jgi:hypothetical protein
MIVHTLYSLRFTNHVGSSRLELVSGPGRGQALCPHSEAGAGVENKVLDNFVCLITQKHHSFTP